MRDVLTRAKYSSPTLVEFANRWKFHARYRVSGVPSDQKYRFLETEPVGPGTILDVGANYGQSALSIRHFASSNPILCLEANPSLVPAMELTQRQVPNCSYLIAAVSDRTGVQELTVPTFGHVANTGGASLDDRFVRGRTALLEERYRAPIGMRTQVVPTITIDSLNLDVPLLKIDVEGLEPMVIRGATDTIDRSRPIIVMEVLHSSGEAMNLLISLDYTLFAIRGAELVPTTTKGALAGGAVDVVALPTERCDRRR